MNERYEITYHIKEVGYNFGTGSDEPHMTMRLEGFQFGHDNRSLISFGSDSPNCIFLYLNKSTFFHLIGRSWDGSYKDAMKFKKDLEGKVFQLDLGMKKEE